MINEYDIKIADLPPAFQELAEEIGLELALKLVEVRGGEGIYIPPAHKICRAARNRSIIEDYKNGMSCRDLKRKYGFTMVWIRTLIGGEKTKKTGIDIIDKQQSLF